MLLPFFFRRGAKLAETHIPKRNARFAVTRGLCLGPTKLSWHLAVVEIRIMVCNVRVGPSMH